MRRLDLLPLLQIRLPPHPSALPLLIAVDLLSLFPALQVAPRVFAELAFRTGRSAPLEPLLLRHDDTSGENLVRRQGRRQGTAGPAPGCPWLAGGQVGCAPMPRRSHEDRSGDRPLARVPGRCGAGGGGG